MLAPCLATPMLRRAADRDTGVLHINIRRCNELLLISSTFTATCSPNIEMMK